MLDQRRQSLSQHPSHYDDLVLDHLPLPLHHRPSLLCHRWHYCQRCWLHLRNDSLHTDDRSLLRRLHQLLFPTTTYFVQRRERHHSKSICMHVWHQRLHHYYWPLLCCLCQYLLTGQFLPHS